MADDNSEKQDFKLDLAQKKFLLKTTSLKNVDREKMKSEILEMVFKEDLAPLYEYLCHDLGWQLDEAKLEAMRARNAAKLEELNAKIKDAEENLGETEVRDAFHARADYLSSLGDKVEAIKAFKETEEKTAGSNAKVDIVFALLRLFILYDDWVAVKQHLARAKQLCEEGGDWEHKNKLKVYEALLCMYTRDFPRAAELLLDSIATFTTTEVFSYSQCIFYAVVTSMVVLDRVTLKKRVVDSPEILQVIGQIPQLQPFLNSLYYCRYSEFFRSFLTVMGQIRSDMYLHPHARYYMREIRVVAYSQFLESYKSVTMESMAGAFDVGVPFLDEEISEFIVLGRLNAKIDKVAGIIETNRPDVKTSFYQDSVKKGDLLLNRIQKLSRVIDVE